MPKTIIAISKRRDLQLVGAGFEIREVEGMRLEGDNTEFLMGFDVRNANAGRGEMGD